MENDKTIKITPIKEENGLYKLIINDYELKEIEYALDKVRRLRESSRKSMAKAKGKILESIDSKAQHFNKNLEALDLSRSERVGLHIVSGGLTAASVAADMLVPSSVEGIAVDTLLLATGAKGIEMAAQSAHRINEARKIGKSLGANPFKNKTFGQINKRLRKEGFTTVGENPAGGEGAYFHPESGRKYYLDEGGNIYTEGQELSHIDVHRKNIETGKSIEKRHQLPTGSKLTEPKRKYPLNDQLIDPTIKPPTQPPKL